MAEQIVMPKLAMAMKHGKVVEWKAQQGEWVEKGQIIMEIETEKVSYEVESPTAGYLHIITEVGEEVAVTVVVALLAETEEELAELQGQQVVAEAMTAEAPAPAVEETAPALAAPASVKAAVTKGGLVKISPLAKKISLQNNLDISQIIGTGPGGRIVKRDVEAAIEDRKTAAVAAEPAAAISVLPESVSTAETVEGRRVREILPLSGMRQAMAKHMGQSLITSARVTTFVEIDMTESIRLRKKLVEKQEMLGTRISYTDLIVFLAARVLRDQPMVNATLTDDGIVLWEDVNIGVALSLAKGGLDTSLIVPVIKQADKKSLVEISTELKEMVRKGREGSLTADDMTGGTFTLTNTAQLIPRWHIQTPMITQPESAILGTSSTVEKPVVKDGEIVIRSMMPISLSFDHRVMDGSQPAAFLNKLAALFEDPDMIWAY